MGPLVTVAEAKETASWKALQSRRWQRLARAVYAPAADRATPMLQLAAAWRRMPDGAVFSGRTAAWLHGVDLPATDPIEVMVPAGHVVSHRAGVRFRKVRLEPSEVVLRHGFRITSPIRTCFDLGSARSLTEAVVALDLAMNAGLVTRPELERLAATSSRRHGVVRLRRAVALADVSESPMESRLRLLLVNSGLPLPTPQVTLHDELGEFIARADLYYESHRLCIEFDGGNHRDRLIDDDRRQNRLVSAGYTVLRFTSADLLGAPERVVALVQAALSAPPKGVFAPNRPSARRSAGGFARNRPGGGSKSA